MSKGKEQNPFEGLVDALGVPSEPERAFNARKVGRPLGRRSSPDYNFLNAILPIELLAKLAFLCENTYDPETGRHWGQSDVLEQLIREWIDLPEHKETLERGAEFIEKRIEEYRQKRLARKF